MFRSLRVRLFLTYLLVTGMMLTVIGCLLFIFLVRAPNPIGQQIEFRRLGFWLSQFTEREGRSLINLPPDKMGDLVARIDQATQARTVLIGSDGEVIVDSRPEETPLPTHVISKVRSNDKVTQGAFNTTLTDRWLYVASRAGSDRWLVLAAPQPTLRAVGFWGDDLLRTLAQAGIVSLLVSAFLAWLIARWVAAPLSRTAEAARAVAQGDYSQQLHPVGPVEAESMALAFNEMVQRVQASRQAQRDFVANVSHELKTPITSIQGFAQAILDETAKGPQERKRAAQVIYDESERLKRLVEDLLDLARIDAGQVVFDRRPIDLVALLNAVIERLSVRAIEHEVRIENRIPVFPTLIGDGDRLAQIFTNLIDNAIKNTSKGDAVTLWGEIEAGWISIHVDDVGPGIPADELSRIFERFYQVDKARAGGMDRGVGLGLAISREIVRAHGGRIVAQSIVGQGSRFTVQLPIGQPDDKTHARYPS